MRTTQRVFARTAMAVALAAIFAPAMAQQSSPGVNAPTDNTVRLGVGISSGDQYDRTMFGQYNGLRNSDTNLLLDFDYNKFGDSGQTTILRGRNLGLDNREVSYTQKKLGDWRLSADYSEIVRHDIRTINTAEGGVGTVAPQVNVLAAPGTGGKVDLSLKRQAFGVSGDKWFASNLQFELAFKNEDKNGARLWGRGYDCATGVCTTTANSATNTKWALLMIPEPLNRNTKQIDAKLNYTTDKLAVTAGYYGSFYSNAYGNVTPTVPANVIGPGGGLVALNAGLQGVLQTPMALPPDNQAHQFYVAGNYGFTPTTRATFKLSRTHATQDEDFSSQGLGNAPAGRSNLGGVYDTTLLQFGISTRPMAKLSLNANIRYEDREDKTPIDTYNQHAGRFWTNGQNGLKKLDGKVEASYQLPWATRGTVGIDYQELDRGTFTPTVEVAGLAALRQKNEEIGYRVELRRMMAETVTGSISYRHSTRDGSTWLKPNSAAQGVTPVTDAAVFAANSPFPYHMTNRERDQIRATADWSPTERLSISLLGQGTRDHYDAPNNQRGLDEGGSRLVNIDVTWQVSQRWKLTAYAQTGETHSEITSSTAYFSDWTERTTAYGVGIVGRLTPRLLVGLNNSLIKDTSHYDLSAPSGASAANVAQAAIGLPDVKYREARMDLFANYALTKSSDLRFDFTYASYFLDEWTWQGVGVPFFYSDNTTVGLVNRDQQVTFLGASYVYRF